MVGQHKGYPFYTIGQRKGLGVAFGEPMFVTQILPESNTVVLGKAEELERREAMVRNINLIKYASIEEPMSDIITKIRYKDAGMLSTIVQEKDKMRVVFDHNVSAIAPGQSAVFYEGNDLLGGGFLI
ncbi:tRNA-specific 2-thiouridylase MnmA [compost metagenome]